MFSCIDTVVLHDSCGDGALQALLEPVLIYAEQADGQQCGNY
jgi:hypothetical protein